MWHHHRWVLILLYYVPKPFSFSIELFEVTLLHFHEITEFCLWNSWEVHMTFSDFITLDHSWHGVGQTINILIWYVIFYRALTYMHHCYGPSLRFISLTSGTSFNKIWTKISILAEILTSIPWLHVDAKKLKWFSLSFARLLQDCGGILLHFMNSPTELG